MLDHISKHISKERFIIYESLRFRFAENGKKGVMLHEKFSIPTNFLIKIPLQC